MLLRLSFVTLILASALTGFGTPTKRDAAQVESDIIKLIKLSKSLVDSINAFSNTNGTYDEAWNIHEAALALASFTENATDDAKAGNTLTDAEANNVTALLNDFTPIVVDGSSDLVAKKSAIDRLEIQGVVKGDIKTLKTNADAFVNALFAIVMESDARAEIQQDINKVDDALDNATKAFGN